MEKSSGPNESGAAWSHDGDELAVPAARREAENAYMTRFLYIINDYIGHVYSNDEENTQQYRLEIRRVHLVSQLIRVCGLDEKHAIKYPAFNSNELQTAALNNPSDDSNRTGIARKSTLRND